LAIGPHREGVFGGAGAQETHEHFALRFGASSSRFGYVLLDPAENHDRIHHSLHQFFSVGRVAMIDLASGCGAMGLAALAYRASLGVSGKAPRLPLEVHFLGLDISQEALDVYSAMHQRLAPSLRSVGLDTHLTTSQCDLRDWFAVGETFERWVRQLDRLSR